jgi:putative serine/threonine protein kinase
LKLLGEERYRRLICYPDAESREFEDRLEELKQLRVTTLEFLGQVQVHGIQVLGKGHVGIVVKAYREAEQVALKIRRTDADRLTMQHEADMLRKANAASVAPRLLGATENFLLMEYVDGVLLPEWVGRLSGKGERTRLCSVLRSTLEQAWRLDEVGLDHGELSQAPRHIIVKTGGEPCLVDFETASTSRRVANVTSLCQYLYLRSPIADTLRRKLDDVDEDDLVNALRKYKLERSRENLLKILVAGRIRKTRR